MRKLLTLTLSVLASCQLRAELGPTAFTLTEPGVGTITLETHNHMEGKQAVFEASARNWGGPLR